MLGISCLKIASITWNISQFSFSMYTQMIDVVCVCVWLVIESCRKCQFIWQRRVFIAQICNHMHTDTFCSHISNCISAMDGRFTISGRPLLCVFLTLKTITMSITKQVRFFFIWCINLLLIYIKTKNAVCIWAICIFAQSSHVHNSWLTK